MYLTSISLFLVTYLFTSMYSILGKSDRYILQINVIMMFGLVLMAMPIATTFQALMLDDSTGKAHKLFVFMQSASVWLTGAGGVMALFISGLTAARLKQKIIKKSALSLNLIIVSLFAGVVTFTSAYKHLIFFSTSEAGVLSALALPAVKDIVCDAPVLLVKWEPTSTEPTEWRCPTGVAFNGNSSSPFVPWGGYTEGKSRELGEFITFMMRNSGKID